MLNKYKLLLLWRSNIRIFHFATEIFCSLGIIFPDGKNLAIKKKTQNCSYRWEGSKRRRLFTNCYKYCCINLLESTDGERKELSPLVCSDLKQQEDEETQQVKAPFDEVGTADKRRETGEGCRAAAGSAQIYNLLNLPQIWNTV